MVKWWAAKRGKLEEGRRREGRDGGETAGGARGEGIREVKAGREEEHGLEIRRGRHNFLYSEFCCVFVVL